jgi:uncharacterized protein YqfA (UPF0365 family)
MKPTMCARTDLREGATMNGNEVIVAVAAVVAFVWVVCLAFFFVYLRLWIQALLTNTPVGIIDIVRMKLRGCPPQVLVHAMISLSQRGVKVTAQEAEGCYLAAVVHGERVATATELADLLEDIKRNVPDAPRA